MSPPDEPTRTHARWTGVTVTSAGERFLDHLRSRRSCVTSGAVNASYSATIAGLYSGVKTRRFRRSARGPRSAVLNVTLSRIQSRPTRRSGDYPHRVSYKILTERE